MCGLYGPIDLIQFAVPIFNIGKIALLAGQKVNVLEDIEFVRFHLGDSSASCFLHSVVSIDQVVVSGRDFREDDWTRNIGRIDMGFVN